ncbi:2OG-Fe(II) oxygenase [Streptomyces acidiscabies]|uniref:2OG-Fe(II) oxygenase n=1 Tax=Streptomyces acidiscabies TaxID=42234 RepID=UPI0038F75C4C
MTPLTRDPVLLADDPVLLAGARSETVPFPYHHLPETFPAEAAARLRETFPKDGFTKVTGHDPDKTYTMWTRPLHPEPAGELPQPWQGFVREVTGARYRAGLAALTGMPVESCPVEVNLWRYPPDCWLDPHVDKPGKLVTHVFYFNEPWSESWGGNLLLLGSRDVHDVVRRVAPLHNSSVVLVRGETSWHAVENARPQNPGAVRLSAQVIFHRPE